MATIPLNFKKANQFLPHIILVGIGIGSANYIMNGSLNWIQWCIQSLSTSIIIGYSLVVIGLNKSWFSSFFSSNSTLYLFLIFAFFFIGIFATEIEHYIRSLVFKSQDFEPFSSGKMYLFNGIISSILGFSFFQTTKQKKENAIENKKKSFGSENLDAPQAYTKEAISNVPVKQGQNILLISINEIVYFEAFDNYSFVYIHTGEKKLCDYSLRFLEQRLSTQFSRVHRKYIVNKSYIEKIQPHLNGRYVIVFNNQVASITSSKSYASAIRKLIKID